MRILGIDPGLRCTGYGVIDYPNVVYVASGCILTNSDADLTARLKSLFEGMQEIILKYSPDIVAIEKVFVNVNPHSSLLLGQARGALLCAGIAQKKMVYEYTALQIKQAVVGYGKAAKIQVSDMVCRLLKLTVAPSLDATDALACAVCHAHSQQPGYAPIKIKGRQKVRWQSWPGRKVD